MRWTSRDGGRVSREQAARCIKMLEMVGRIHELHIICVLHTAFLVASLGLGSFFSDSRPKYAYIVSAD